MAGRMTEYNDIACVSGFLQGACDHLAIEQTGLRPGSEEVCRRSQYLQMCYQELLIPACQSITDWRDVLTHLEGLAGDSLDEQLQPQLPRVAGYVLGAACAGYTMLVLACKHNAMDIRTGELWMARKYIGPEDVEFPEGSANWSHDQILAWWLDNIDEDEIIEKRLLSLMEKRGTILRLRWAADDEIDDGWLTIKGAALPPLFVIPPIDLQLIRDNPQLSENLSCSS
jgi:hypothetical protein